MLQIYQKTIIHPISFEGIGLHSGKSSKITIFPGTEDQGIIFKRVDVKQNNLITASYENVSSARLCTTLENKHGIKVSTVEHLLAALYIAGIDNAVIELDNEEIPIMDGSAKDFLKKLIETEIKTLPKKRKYLKILEKVELQDGEKSISIEPNRNAFEVDFQLNYNNEIIGKQRNTVNFETDQLNEVTQSRTFCLFEDIEEIKKIGLAKGGSLNNAIVVKNETIINEGGLRNEKEFVNHKILDLAGDFVLSGYRILGKVCCYQGGHLLSNLFLKKLLKSKNSYSEIAFEEIVVTKKRAVNHISKIAANA